MASLNERGIERYDLVTAFCLWPGREDDLFRKLTQVCGRALTPDGNLLVTSDLKNFSAAQEACEEAGIPFNKIRGVSSEGKLVVPNVLIIPQASCENITSFSPRRRERNPFELDFGKDDLFSKKFRLFDIEGLSRVRKNLD